jgi:hypothetical protein
MMDRTHFEENLLLYGAKLHQWPEEVKNAGLQALENSSEIRTLLAEHEEFEKALKVRNYDEPDRNLAQRIISASLRQEQKVPFSLRTFSSSLLGEFHFSRPAAAAFSLSLIAVLILGFVVGYSNPPESVLTAQDETSLQTFLYDEGDAL